MKSHPHHGLTYQFIRIFILLLCLGFITYLFAANTVTANQLGQGVVYAHYHYDNLYNSLQEVYLLYINLNDHAHPR